MLIAGVRGPWENISATIIHGIDPVGGIANLNIWWKFFIFQGWIQDFLDDDEVYTSGGKGTTYYLDNFSRELLQNEKIALGGRGGGGGGDVLMP